MDRNQIKILIIEDDLIIAKDLKENLFEMGYTQVIVASECEAAAQLYNEYEPDLCLVDVKLQGSKLDGIQLVHREKMSDRCLVIYLTSFIDDQTRKRAKATNPSAYLVKPSNKIQIDLAIDMAMNIKENAKPNHQSYDIDKLSILNFMFLKVKYDDYDRYEKFSYHEITYLKSEGSYTDIYCGTKKPVVCYNLKRTLELIKQSTYVRCHRSFAVNVHHIESFDNNHLYVANNQEIIKVPIGESFKYSINKILIKM